MEVLDRLTAHLAALGYLSDVSQGGLDSILAMMEKDVQEIIGMVENQLSTQNQTKLAAQNN